MKATYHERRRAFGFRSRLLVAGTRERENGMKQLCHPKMLDCISCEHNCNPKESFCYVRDDCSVPFAVVENGKILIWIDD